MIKRTSLLIIFFITYLSVSAQNKVRLDLSASKNKSVNIKSDKNGIHIKETISFIDFEEKETKNGKYLQLTSEGMCISYDIGKPNLPLFSRLIEIPLNTKAIIKVLNYDEKIINLNDYNLISEIIPAQASLSKSDEAKNVPFIKNSEIYTKDEYFKNEIIRFQDRGYLRNKHLGYIEISPFEYNPVTNTLKILNNLEIDIRFINDNNAKSIKTENLASPYFDNIDLNTINKNDGKALLNGPVKYVIVSDRMFEETLQEFIQWKTMKGFTVIEAYTDDPDLGTTTSSIRAYLKNLYDNPSDGISPTFILFVGDVEQIPAFAGTTDEHVTDLYYCEYTDDKLPEVFYGRFSATSIEELEPQIDKTLEVERYEMPDASYLNNSVIVAGHDDYGHDLTVGNGLVNYATKYYLNEDNGITTNSYLSPESQNFASEIRSKINAGVSIANYTAHCNSNGWGNPSFTTSNIQQMDNEHMYPLMIGNCCLSNKFDNASCFGESLLRAKDKGAVGYIGASNSSLWDEDFYWGVGLAEKSANPTYEESDLGFYDRFFHSKGEEKNDWYITQGQMITAGNLAVESSPSIYKAYYWEIYHLMGDPSLTPYITVPEILTASYNSEIALGASNFQVTTEKDAYVALSYQGLLLDAKLVDESGIINLSFSSLKDAGTLDLVITKQNRQAKIDQVKINPNCPFVVLDTFVIDDKTGNANGRADFNETLTLDVKLKNISELNNALNVTAKLTSLDTNIIITDDTESYGTINKTENLNIESAFGITLKTRFENQHIALFDVNVTGEDVDGKSYKWNSTLKITLNAPQLEIKDIFVGEDSQDHNILSPGETENICLTVTNTGNASILDISSIAKTLANGSSYLSFNNSEIKNINLETQQTDTIKFNVSIDPSTPIGTSVYLNFNINDNPVNYYSQSVNKKFIIGETPEVLISRQGVVETNYCYFYDAGGENNNYAKNEDYTITFTPEDTEKHLMVNFLSFDIESGTDDCYDYLEVFDGENTNAPLIDSYCNANKPASVKATNDKGALTFRFYSDVSVTEPGWKAEIISLNGYNYQLTVNGTDSPIEGAVVILNNDTLTSGSDGIVSFTNTNEGINIPLSVTASGYEIFSTTINLFEDLNQEVSLHKILYDITFVIKDKFSHTPVEDASIDFMGQKVNSNENGEYIFEDLEPRSNEAFTISKEGFEETSNTLNINDNKNIIINLEPINYNVSFIVLDADENPLEDVDVSFNSISLSTDAEGIAIFKDILPANDLAYTLSKVDYEDITGTIDVEDQDLTINEHMELINKTYDVTYIIVDSEVKALNDVSVNFNSTTVKTNSEGIALFEDVTPASSLPYTLSKDGYNDITGSVNVEDQDMTVNQKMTLTTGILNFEDQMVNVYPNPSNGIFNVKITNTENTEYSLKIFDVLGSQIYCKTLLGKTNIMEHIDLSGKARGLYFIIIESNEGLNFSEKLFLK